MSVLRSLQRRLDSETDKTSGHGPQGDCWLWIGAKSHNTYGHFYAAGRNHSAHRVAYELSRGREIPETMEVCHKCDVPACVKPTHLFLGTRKINMRDAKRKGRLSSGEKHYNAKLTDTQVAEIRRLRAGGMKQNDIAQRFGVSFQHVSDLVRGSCRK